ncbi:hypothetical protein ACH5RR_003011 [Cinchona calisaya]|uniref:Uncharacterized protein n=1 Tax=Cinchona calisaya TaxID=153742 RepID=A0ABD3ATK7_9GENT
MAKIRKDSKNGLKIKNRKSNSKLGTVLKASQRHLTSIFKTVLRPEQHVPFGFFTVLPLVRKDKQLATFSAKLNQSAASFGAVWPDPANSPTAFQIKIRPTMKNITTFFFNAFSELPVFFL